MTYIDCAAEISVLALDSVNIWMAEVTDEAKPAWFGTSTKY